jgi:hypothetical protein
VDVGGIQKTSDEAFPSVNILDFIEEEPAFLLPVVGIEAVICVKDVLAVFQLETGKTVILEVQVKDLIPVCSGIKQFTHLLIAETCFAGTSHPGYDSCFPRQNRERLLPLHDVTEVLGLELKYDLSQDFKHGRLLAFLFWEII